jgi:hypothetical protein
VLEGAEIHEASAPAIKISGADGRLDGIVATAEEKARIFMAQAFPTQTGVDGEPSLSDSMVSVSARNIREALFTWLVEKAPEVDSIGFRALGTL